MYAIMPCNVPTSKIGREENKKEEIKTENEERKNENKEATHRTNFMQAKKVSIVHLEQIQL